MTTLHAQLARVLMETLIMGAVLKIRALRMHLALLYREVICFELRWTTTTDDYSALRLSSIHVINPEMPEIL
jgi:hypothetical protein